MQKVLIQLLIPAWREEGDGEVRDEGGEERWEKNKLFPIHNCIYNLYIKILLF